MASQLSHFTTHPANESDYPALTFISLDAIRINPFFYLTFSPSTSPERISQYHFQTKIEPPDDISVEIVKVVDNSCLPVPKIIGFASWKIGRCRIEARKPELPEGANGRFLEEFWEMAGTIVDEFFNPDTDIELSIMRVLPEYQGRGLGGMLLKWGLEKAMSLGKRIFLLSSPEGKNLYTKYGFKILGTVNMELDKYGGRGTYRQSAMIWKESVILDERGI